MHEVWRAVCFQNQENLRHIMTLVREKGELKDELPVDVATMMVFCFIGGIVERWLLMPELLNLKKQGDIMLAAFFDGLKKRD